MAQVLTQFEDVLLETGTPAQREQILARRAQAVRVAEVRLTVEFRAYGLVQGKNTLEELEYRKWNRKAEPVLLRKPDGTFVAAEIGAAVIAVLNGAELL